MIVKGVLIDDFVNYLKPSMTVLFPFCTFKCERETKNEAVCQNKSLIAICNVDISAKKIVEIYDNNIARALLLSGLEPFDSFDSVLELIREFRRKHNDDIVIYSGYTEEEIDDKIQQLQKYNNIIVKCGRYIPNQNPHFDEVLGVNLASNNQYAKRIS